jgi:2-polyprenyl-6-methoxyphenol hydroxylase-like FAD-dependent oxidoreductase
LRKEGVAAVARRVRQFDPIFADFANSLTDLTPFFPLECIVRLIDDWARDGLLLIGDAAHTMSPVGAIGVNVAIATAAVAAQELYPRFGRGPIPRTELQAVQRLREADVRTLHQLQLRAQQLLLSPGSSNPIVKSLFPVILPLVLKTPLLPRMQRRMFFGVPLPPLDPAFRFQASAAASA